jgi:hypothetical protein
MTHPAARRRVALLAVPLALLAALAIPVGADEPAADASQLSLPHASMWAGPQMFGAELAPAGDAMRAGIHPVSGALRQPTAAQVELLAALDAPVFHRAFAASQVEMADGTVMMALDPELVSYSVVHADGAGFACVDGPTHAAALDRAATSAPAAEEK